MPFRFKRKESVTKAVRRLCLERLDDALEPLENGNGFDAVHHVRKEIKKLRALLRLVRPGIGKEAYCENTNILRDAADRLTAVRDAQVKLSALEQLAKDFNGNLPAQPFSKIQNALRENCQAQGKKLGRSIAAVKMDLQVSKQRFDRLKVKPNGWKAIRPGLEKIYRRGRKAFKMAGRKSSPENFHEWRKRVKDLAHELRLLCRACPRKLCARMDDLDKLGELLGDDHDLFMLKEFVGEKFKRVRTLNAFERCISARQEELRSAALKLGSSFYSEKPAHFCHQIGHAWKVWKK